MHRTGANKSLTAHLSVCVSVCLPAGRLLLELRQMPRGRPDRQRHVRGVSSGPPALGRLPLLFPAAARAPLLALRLGAGAAGLQQSRSGGHPAHGRRLPPLQPDPRGEGVRQRALLRAAGRHRRLLRDAVRAAGQAVGGVVCHAQDRTGTVSQHLLQRAAHKDQQVRTGAGESER